MLVLDTDHFSEWESASAAGVRLRARLPSAESDLAVTVVTVEEQMRGWPKYADTTIFIGRLLLTPNSSGKLKLSGTGLFSRGMPTLQTFS